MTNRRLPAVIAVVLCALFNLAAPAAAAETYPTKPVKTFVPFPAGTGMDILARAISDQFQAVTGQTFIVENRVGAGSIVAMQALSRSKPDGYTIAVSPGVSASMYLFKDVPFDPVKDFERVTQLVKVPYFLLINPEKTPVNSVQELTAWLKAKKGRVTFGSPNAPSRVAALLYTQKAGIDAQMILYKGMIEAMRDLQGGDYDFIFSDSGFAQGPMRSGKVKALAVTLPERVKIAPNVPTMAEGGIPGIDLYGWIGIYLPAGGPPDLPDRLAKLINEATARPEMQKFYFDNGYVPAPSNPKDFTAFEAENFKIWADLAKLAGIEPQ